MTTFKVGSNHVTRIEEMLLPGFKPALLFPVFTPDIFVEHAVGHEVLERAQRERHVKHAFVDRLGRSANDPERHRMRQRQDAHAAAVRALPTVASALSRAPGRGKRPTRRRDGRYQHPHLHIEHVVRNTRHVDGRWMPTFPNAKHVFSCRQVEQWRSQTGDRITRPEQITAIEDSVLPVIEAGHVEFSDDGSKIIESLFFLNAVATLSATDYGSASPATTWPFSTASRCTNRCRSFGQTGTAASANWPVRPARPRARSSANAATYMHSYSDQSLRHL